MCAQRFFPQIVWNSSLDKYSAYLRADQLNTHSMSLLRHQLLRHLYSGHTDIELGIIHHNFQTVNEVLSSSSLRCRLNLGTWTYKPSTTKKAKQQSTTAKIRSRIQLMAQTSRMSETCLQRHKTRSVQSRPKRNRVCTSAPYWGLLGGSGLGAEYILSFSL